MNAAIRILIGVVVFVVILLVGAALGVHPSFAEVFLVAVAAGASEGVREGLR